MTAVDRNGLARRLRQTVAGEVRFDTASRALYATDASNYRQPPIGVVVPRTIEDVLATHAACREHGAPILPRGCGTSLSGEAVNVAIVIDFSKHLDRILEIDPDRRLVRVQAGAINEKVNDAVAPYGLVFGPDPSTHAYCTIGGNVGNNSCGTHSVQAQFEGEGGRTSDNVHELEVLTYDGVRMRVGRTSDDEVTRIVDGGGRRGEIYAALRDLRDRSGDRVRERFPNVPRRVSGYNLDELLPEKGFHVARALVGTEGTCVTVLEATLQLIAKPGARALLVVGYEDVCAGAEQVAEMLAARPLAVETFERSLVGEGGEPELPPGEAWVLVELGGETKEEATERAGALRARLERGARGVRVVEEAEEAKRVWEVRERGLAAAAFLDGRDHWPGWEDSAVPPERLAAYLRDLRALFGRHGYDGAFYGHLGQGCIHVRIDFDLRSPDGIRRYRAFVQEAAELVVSYGGSLSGEHGDGQARAELLPRLYGDEVVEAFREFKRIWDPDWKMNPGKVVDPRRLDQDLKFAGLARPRVVFAYPADNDDFAHAAVRCVGVGKCRKPDGADVMCPSYVVTREEKHTTRGRARLLFEMLHGDVVTGGWRSREVLEALDLCLACKGCTSDCPVHVDMPTYKAEFLHHHYARRLRPRHAYAFGLIDQSARVAAHMPAVATLASRTRVAKRLAGVAPQREIPRFAPLTLRAWFARRGPRNPHGRELLLWPDTFTNYFHPEVGVAAVETLEAHGYRVTMPPAHLCCGRPLYDYGMLGLARRYLTNVLAGLRDEIRAAVPVVGLEPSCVATFKDELSKMLPGDEEAGRLARAVQHIAEFLVAEGVDPPRLERKALVWGHCHQKATGGMAPDHELLRRMGLEVEPLNGGCCGLAGSFGFEAAHYEISMACGEQALLPAVRAAAPSTLVVANGFSCRTQIEHGTGRRPLHLAQVLALAHEAAG